MPKPMSHRCLLFALTFGCLMATAQAAPLPGYFLNLGLYRPSTNHVYAYADLTTKVFALNGTYGVSGGTPVVGDFDGNGVYDLAVYRAGVWSIDLNHDYSSDNVMNFGGAAADIPLAADFDGDGIADLVIYRTGTWFIRSSKTGAVSQRTLGGAANDIPVIADFDGDGMPDIAVYRAGTWLIQTHSASGADIVDHFGGLPEDKPCAVDWDHDGRADLCIYRNGIWRFKSVGGIGLLDTYAFGGPGDIPLSGGVFDYAGAIYVKAGATGTQDGTAAHPFATISQAFDAAANGSVIRVAGGTYTEQFLLWGPAHNYAPGKFGKNDIRLLGVSRRAVNLSSGDAANKDAITLLGSTGDIVEGFSIGAPTRHGIQLIGGAGSTSPSDPGSTLSLAFNTISDTFLYGVFITGSSSADIRHNSITMSQTKSGILALGSTPSGTIAYNELAQHGYTLASGADGNGVETRDSASFTIMGNNIHDNNRFGIIGVTNSHLIITANTITASQLNGIILCGGAPNDMTTAQITGNLIAGNGINKQNGQGYNGVEFFQYCAGTQIVSGNTFDSNSLNAIFIGGGTLTATNNVMTNNADGIALYADNNSSANTVANIFGNTFTNNAFDGVFADLVTGTTRSITATVGGTQPNQSNSFTGQGFHGIGCNNNLMQLTCPTGGNTFSGNTDDIESICPATCVK